ncbi:MAG: DUF3326 domain-containing protein [Candidatus Micrarchaeota archaeon]
MCAFITTLMIPTGIKASVGGYLGDATPFANLIASISDYTITHPNVVNGGVLNLMRENIVYTEGTLFDMFFRGEIKLDPSKGNRIGVVVEKNDDKGAMALLKNTVNGLHADGGINVVGIEMTGKKVGAEAIIKNGVAYGSIKDLTQFDKPIKKLIAKGAQSIALSIQIDSDPKLWEEYYKGKLPNPVGALEAVVSHYVVKKYKMPAAHAPLVSEKDWKLNLKDEVVYWRAGEEAISPAYLGCVLIGLSRAPKISKKGIGIEDVSALVIPHSACGGIPVFESMKKKIPIIAVKEIETNLNVTPKSIGIKAIEVETLDEALGRLIEIKEGIMLE